MTTQVCHSAIYPAAANRYNNTVDCLHLPDVKLFHGQLCAEGSHVCQPQPEFAVLPI